MTGNPSTSGQDMTDQRRDRNDSPTSTEPRPRCEGPAAGTVEHAVAPGEAQPGDLNEAAGNLGGPVDVFPGRRRNRGNPTG